ncbi:MAG: hypothetical protein ACI9PN_002931 [Candidatus Azotimanducaceae bacterium]|jgi:hypothetical protein
MPARRQSQTLFFVLWLALSAPLTLSAAEDWQEITTTRLPSPVNPVIKPAITPTDENAAAPETDSEIISPREIAQINGAFGIEFDQPLDPGITRGLPDWQAPPPLPAGLVYTHPSSTFLMSAVQVQPVALPVLLAGAEHQYRSYVDFNNKPVWVVAQIRRDMPEVIAILTRKYGEPTLLDNAQRQFSDGENIIRVSQKEQTGTLEYIHISGMEAYLQQRNMSLRDKYTATPRSGLTPEEAQIMSFADQFAVISRQEGPAFGLSFGRRVNFRATPGEAVAFVPPRPLRGLGDGDYSIVVSPKLLPMIASLKIKGTAVALSSQKKLLDDALRVIFGRFLKHTSQHSVISVQGMSMSVLQRGGVLTLSVHDSAESRRVHNAERLQTHLIAEKAVADRTLQLAREAEAKALAVAELARLAELEARRLEMAARRAEQGF